MLPEYLWQGGEVVSQFRTWGPNIGFGELLQHITLEKDGCAMTTLRNHPDGRHQCMGSTKKGAKLIPKAEVHAIYLKNYKSETQREKLRFTLALGVLHSWDKSYIGSMKCGLYRRKDDHKLTTTPIVENIIHGYEYNHQPVRDSTPRNIIITQNLTSTEHLLECENLEEGKLSCITNVSIFTNEDSDSIT